MKPLWQIPCRLHVQASASAPPDRRSRRLRTAFTLIEAALTTVIVGTGVLAIVIAQQAFLKKNEWAQRIGQAVLLANEIRELTLSLPMHDPLTGKAHLGPEPGETSLTDYDDLDDFAGPVVNGLGQGLTISPPINALRQTIPELEGWSQHIRVENVLPNCISATQPQPLGTTDLVRITVTVFYQNPGDPEPTALTQLTWLVAPIR